MVSNHMAEEAAIHTQSEAEAVRAITDPIWKGAKSSKKAGNTKLVKQGTDPVARNRSWLK